MAKKKKPDMEYMPSQLPSPITAFVSFDSWWAMSQRKYKFEPYMKEVLYKHFTARGFMESGAFDDGLSDFGIKS